MSHRTLAAAIAALLFACAGGAVPPATEPVDWTEAGQPWSVFIVTEDPDGSERSIRIWLVVDDGTGVIRTGNSRWWANLQRNPSCRLRAAGAEYRLRAVPITDIAERQRVDEAFLAKYGWQERTFIKSDRAGSGDPYLRLLPRD
ncbi:MAG: hypothetical protein CL910_06590 [Deltaproteobacteria bacterium]|jgi:hypothetical protein|nr:hypothetical protein [Deltaproteobacteria bacterium]